ncbi:MAG: hypothetical protein ACU833_04360 [Gammaproteobacteria bacterium]
MESGDLMGTYTHCKVIARIYRCLRLIQQENGKSYLDLPRIKIVATLFLKAAGIKASSSRADPNRTDFLAALQEALQHPPEAGKPDLPVPAVFKTLCQV